MTTAHFILKRFGFRLRQVHLSEVNTSSKHDRLSYGAIRAFQEVAILVPESVPVILETPVTEDRMDFEIERAREALSVVRRDGKRCMPVSRYHEAGVRTLDGQP